MRKRKPNIALVRGAPKERIVRIPIKKATAENLLKMNQMVAAAQEELNRVLQQAENHVMPLVTEAGYKGGTVVDVTQKEPYELVLKVTQ